MWISQSMWWPNVISAFVCLVCSLLAFLFHPFASITAVTHISLRQCVLFILLFEFAFQAKYHSNTVARCFTYFFRSLYFHFVNFLCIFSRPCFHHWHVIFLVVRRCSYCLIFDCYLNVFAILLFIDFIRSVFYYLWLVSSELNAYERFICTFSSNLL